MIQIKTKKSLPVIAVFKGEVPGEDMMFVYHCKPHDGIQGWSYQTVTTPEQLAEVKKNPALAGFKNTINGFPSRYERVTIHYEVDDVIDGDREPYQVLLIAPTIPVVRHHLQLGDIVTVISDKTMPPDAMVYPIPSKRVSVKYDFPVITPASFDLVKADTTAVNTFDDAGLRDYAEDALRPGGIMQLTATERHMSYWTRNLATRFERLSVDTKVYSEDCHQPDPDAVTVYGVKKAVRKHDPAEQAYLDVCLEQQIKKEDRIPGAIYRYAATPWNPGQYPPARTVTAKTVKRYDDSKYMSLAEDKETLPVKVSPSKGTDVFSDEFLHTPIAELKKFCKSAKVAWGSGKGGGYDLELDNPAEQLPALRKFLAEEKQGQWEVHIKGQKAITSTFLEEVVHPEFSPAAGLKPTLLPKYIDLDFAETWFCNAEPLPEEEVVEDSKQLVFPVAPSLANLMKLFGQLRPAVIQGKDGVYYLASGTVNTEVLYTDIIDDKGREVKVENTKKRAKLVTFALTGTDAGQQYEAEMS